MHKFQIICPGMHQWYGATLFAIYKGHILVCDPIRQVLTSIQEPPIWMFDRIKSGEIPYSTNNSQRLDIVANSGLFR
jgi:hypothetical protein